MKQYFRKTDIYFVILALGITFCMIFMNVNYDFEYQLAMAFRRYLGDRPITQMWEPHQTSVFLNVFLIRIFMAVTGSSAGLVVFMQAIGWMIRLLLAIWMYHSFAKVCERRTALLVFLLYLLISPKEVMGPEFANMQLWFGTILLLSLVRYFESNQKIWVVIAAFSLCLEILSYPSCVVVYFAASFLMWKYAKDRWGAIGSFTVVCTVFGVAVLWYYFHGIEPDIILNCLRNALAVEPTHTVGTASKLTAYLKNILTAALILGGVGCTGMFLHVIGWKIIGKKNLKDSDFHVTEGLVWGWYGLLIYLFGNIIRADNRGGYVYLLLYFIIMGWIGRKYLVQMREKRMFVASMLIGFFQVLATMILSDNPFLQSVPYGLLGICGCMLPIMRYATEKIKIGINLFLLLLIFRCAYVHIPIYGYSQICSLSSDLALIRRGPAMGIITDEEGAARQRDSYAEWEEYIEDGSRIWIVGGAVVDTLGYLYRPTVVAAPSTMADPTYGEELRYYWELNPEKFPDVVVVASGFGELSYEVLNDKWLMGWLENDFRASKTIDGNYWRYYFR